MKQAAIDATALKAAAKGAAERFGRLEAAPATVPPRQSKRTVVIAVVVALLMAVAGIAVGMMVLGDDEPAPAEPPPSIELGDIEVQSH